MRKSYGKYSQNDEEFDFICLHNEELQFVFNNLRFDWKDHNCAEIRPGFISRTLWEQNFHRSINSIHFLLEGEAVLRIREKTMRLRAGDVFLIGNRVGCQWEYVAPSKEITLLFNLYLGSLDDLFDGVREPMILSGQETLVEEMHRLFAQAGVPAVFAMRNLCMEKILEFLQKSGLDLARHIQVTQKYEKVFQYITENLSMNLHIDEIAKNTNYSIGFFTKSFVRDNGMTVKQYIHDKVMSEVEQRLIYTKQPLAEIAEEYGFCELSYFTRWFKRYQNCAPSEYRKKLQGMAAK